MNRLTTILIALLLPLVVRAADFEGTVTVEMTGPRERTTPMTFSIKPGLARIDTNAGGGRFGGMIMDQKKQEILILMPEQHMYMIQPIPQGAVDQVNQKAGEADVQATNEHAKILGYDTTKYVAKTSEGTTELWMTDQLGTFQGLGLNRPMGPMARGSRPNAAQAWEKAFKGKDAFPLRVVTTDSSGKQTFQMQATDVQKKSLPDSLFQAPAGFRKFDMGAMMRGMGGLPGMPGASKDE